ncbi:SIMPL domain-containing protein [Acetobacter sp. AN02]|uniref:SIMPL domain-containing protein n=1 Tax=Acetobacter sp. AN02 TaxID=2894186 RepID=UPI0024341BB4|nr:SIMPL domain-containing protein [Acetobacter sp. AN02]MDG6095339.1 SIMPL domain-containing protein [Acetobacter sp. AN02]
MRTVLLAGLSLFPVLLPAAALADDSATPVISVTGTGKAEVMPDRVTIRYTVRGEGKTQDDAIKALVRSRARIDAGIEALKKNIVQNSSQMNVAEVRAGGCRRYGPGTLSEGECAIVGYVASLPVSIETPAVTDAGTIVGQISRLGGWQPSVAQFFLAHPEDAAQKAIIAASEDARKKAAALAEGMHVQLGAVRSITLEDNGERPPMLLRARAFAAEKAELDMPAPPPPVAVSMQPEPIEVTRTIQTSWRIGP